MRRITKRIAQHEVLGKLHNHILSPKGTAENNINPPVPTLRGLIA